MNQLSKVSVVKVGAFSYTRYPELDPVIKLIDEQSKDYYANPLLDPEHTLISEIVEVHLEHVPQESQNQLRLLKLRICREKAVETYARDIADRDKEMEKLERLGHDQANEQLGTELSSSTNFDAEIPF